MSEKPYVFICYSRQNSTQAEILFEKLTAHGISVFIDRISIQQGEEWDRAVMSALQQCTAMVTLNSQAFNASRNTLDEVNFFLEAGKTIFPLLLDNSKPYFRLARHQYINASIDLEAAIDILIHHIQQPGRALPLQPHIEKPALSLDQWILIGENYNYRDIIAEAQSEIRMSTRLGHRFTDANLSALRQAVSQGCQIKMMIAAEDAISHLLVYSGDPNRQPSDYLQNQRQCLSDLRRIAQNPAELERIQIRRLPGAAPYNHFQVDPDAPNSTIRIMLYSFVIRATDRLELVIERQHSPQMWQHFNDDFERVWAMCEDTQETLTFD